MILKVNGVSTELIFCGKHGNWFAAGDETNCCEQEREGSLHVQSDNV